jgi:hypothetical protein
MMRPRLGRIARLLAAALPLLACGVATSERSACEGVDAGANVESDAGTIAGSFNERPVPPAGGAVPTTFPITISVLLRSDYLIAGVTIGDRQARLKDAKGSEWEAKLYADDLESNRVGNQAHLTARATDLCGRTYVLDDEITIPLGPAAPLTISDLKIEPELSPSDECSVPVDGRVQPLIGVSADLASAGATVRLQASQAGLTGKSVTVDLTLIAAGARARASAFFVPQSPGYAVFTAAGPGSSAKPVVVLVVDRPEMTALPPLLAGVDHFVTVRSAGNLATCVTEDVGAGHATVNIVGHAPDEFNGPVSVKRPPPVSCDEPEIVRVKVAFAKDSPAGSAVRLRCWDSFGQEASQTYTRLPD